MTAFVFLQALSMDGILPAPPPALLASGQSARVPLLIGNAAQELTLQGGDSAVRRAVVGGYGDSSAAAMKLMACVMDGTEATPFWAARHADRGRLNLSVPR